MGLGGPRGGVELGLGGGRGHGGGSGRRGTGPKGPEGDVLRGRSRSTRGAERGEGQEHTGADRWKSRCTLGAERWRQEHAGCQQVKEQKHAGVPDGGNRSIRGCRTEALSAERICGEAAETRSTLIGGALARGCRVQSKLQGGDMVGERAKFHGHTHATHTTHLYSIT